MEDLEDSVSARSGCPSILHRFTRTFSGLGRAPANAASDLQHAFGIDDGYDSEEDEEISEALFREVRGLGGRRQQGWASCVVCGPCRSEHSLTHPASSNLPLHQPR